MCEHKNINKCKAKSCPFAHSMEELSAWEEALAVERGTVENGEDWETNMNNNHIIRSKAVSERVASKRMREYSLSSFDTGFERLEGDPGNEPFVDTRFISRITDSTYWTVMCLLTQRNKALIGMPSQEPSSQTHNSATPDQMPNGTNPVNNPAGDKPRTPDEWFDDDTQIPKTQNPTINRPVTKYLVRVKLGPVGPNISEIFGPI